MKNATKTVKNVLGQISIGTVIRWVATGSESKVVGINGQFVQLREENGAVCNSPRKYWENWYKYCYGPDTIEIVQ